MEIIKKGTKLKVIHNRKGTFVGTATKDFDPHKSEWYPIAVSEFVDSASREFGGWEPGDSIPCRASFCKIEVLKELTND